MDRQDKQWGRSAQDTGDPDYVSGYGGSGQHGLVVLIFQLT